MHSLETGHCLSKEGLLHFFDNKIILGLFCGETFMYDLFAEVILEKILIIGRHPGKVYFGTQMKKE